MTLSLSVRTLQQLQTIVRQLQDNPSYMAWIISRYQRQEKLSSQKLTNLLGINEESLAKIALCIRPDSNSSDFSKQIHQISEYTGIDPLALAKFIHQSESVIALSSRPSANLETKANARQLNFATARDKTEEMKIHEDNKEEGDVAEQ